MKPTTVFLLITLTTSVIGSCQTGTEPTECPDTTFSQTNLDTLEAKNPKFIWRICNANEKYVIQEIETFSKKVDFQKIDICTCSKYTYSEGPLLNVNYKINGEKLFPAYLDHYKATRGLVDSTEIRQSPGRYTYFFYYDYLDGDSSNNSNYRIEIKREAHHE